MAEFPFYLFAFLTVAAAAGVVVNRNAVNAALCLLLSFAGMAALFVLLEAYFLAAVQVLVYAGAVMVLFLFVIMLLDLKAEERQKVKKFGVISGLVSVGTILGIFLRTLLQSPLTAEKAPTLEGTTIPLGHLLFTDYLLPFEIVSLLLLVAMVGVILLSKKDLK